MSATGPYQEFDPLTPEELSALEQDILQRGVQVPIVLDEHGNVLDGHHRLAVCKKHGIIDYPTTLKAGLTEDEKRDYAQSLNMARRSLTREQRQKQIRNRLRRNPDHSDRNIAQALGVDHKTVGRIRKELESAGEVPQIDVKLGLNGMRYKAAAKPKLVDATGGEVPQRLHSVFVARPEFISLANILCEVKRSATDLANRTDLSSKLSILLRHLEKAEQVIRESAPHAVHSACGGEGCSECGQRGYTCGEVPQHD